MRRVDISFPLRTDASGRTATADYDEHVRQLVTQLVLTDPGERVMRPSFGGGAGRLVFVPAGDTLVGALRYRLTMCLTQELSEVIDVRAVDVSTEDLDSGALRIDVSYVVRAHGEIQETVIRIGALS